MDYQACFQDEGENEKVLIQKREWIFGQSKRLKEGSFEGKNLKSRDQKGGKKMNIELKAPTKADRKELVDLCNAIDRSYLSDRLPYPYTKEDADRWLDMVENNQGKSGIWRLILADNKVVGNISVEQKEGIYRKDAEIGYLLRTQYWSKGIATDAVRRICRIAFEELDIIRITGLYYEPNLASGRVLEKAGFEREGMMKNAVLKGERIYNLCIMGLLREGGCGSANKC